MRKEIKGEKYKYKNWEKAEELYSTTVSFLLQKDRKKEKIIFWIQYLSEEEQHKK